MLVLVGNCRAWSTGLVRRIISDCGSLFVWRFHDHGSCSPYEYDDSTSIKHISTSWGNNLFLFWNDLPDRVFHAYCFAFSYASLSLLDISVYFLRDGFSSLISSWNSLWSRAINGSFEKNWLRGNKCLRLNWILVVWEIYYIAFYYKCCKLIGYATRYLIRDRQRVK